MTGKEDYGPIGDIIRVKWDDTPTFNVQTGVYPDNLEIVSIHVTHVGKCAICQLECGGTCYEKW